MTRRTLLGISTALYHSQPLFGQEIRPNRTLAVGPKSSDPAIIVSNLAVQGDTLYALIRDRRRRLDRVESLTLSGSPISSFNLESGVPHIHLQLTTGGRPIVVRMEQGRASACQYDTDGKQTRQTPLPELPLATCMSGNALIGFYRDSTLRATDVTSGLSVVSISAVLAPVAIGGFVPPLPSVTLHNVDSDIYIMDHASARLISVALATKARHTYQIEAPELEQTRKQAESMVAQVLAENSPLTRRTPATPVLIHLTTTINGTLLCMPSPVNVKRTLLFEIDREAKIVRRFHLVLPDSEQDKVPTMIFSTNKTVGLGYPNGTIAQYSVA